jgi:nucleotide-binding universal stress UspA family protein
MEANMTPLRSILAASDLGSGSDPVVASAALLAARTGAELHLIHSLELPLAPSGDVAREIGFFERIAEAEERLGEQAGRTLPEGLRPASRRVVIHIAHKAILDRAVDVSADLIVVGPHRGGAAGAHFLGTTADRVVRTSEVPCLVVHEPMSGRIRRVGVPVDCSDPSQGALETALAWALQLGEGAEAAGAPEVRMMHVGWPVDLHDVPDLERSHVRPRLERQVERAVSRVAGAEALRVGIEVLWANDPTDAVLTWAKEREIDLLVMGTHGRSGLSRALVGSVASGIARRTPRPVLLVPPAYWSGQAHAPRLQRIMVGTDFGEPSLEAARWSMRDFAPDAEHLLVHVVEVPEPPAVLAGRFGPREELLRTARAGARERLEEARLSLESPGGPGAPAVGTEVLEGEPAEEIVRRAGDADVDLLVVGDRGPDDRRRGAWALLGATAERVLRGSSTPVLAVREPRPAPLRTVLAAVDGSGASLHALRWAELVRERLGASLHVVHVERPVLSGYAATAGALAAREGGAPGVAAAPLAWAPGEPLPERESWVREQVRRAGIDPGSVEVGVELGSPAAGIVAEAGRIGADLVVMGAHGRGPLGRALLGSVAGAVLRTAPCPVLLVPDPARRRA